MSLNPWSLIPIIQKNGISGIIPRLDSIIAVADPLKIPTDHWLNTILTQTIMPAASAILLFTLCCAFIHEQRKAVSGQSNFARVFYRLVFTVGALAGYRYFFGQLLQMGSALGDLFLQDEQITQLTEEMYENFKDWNFGSFQWAKAFLVGIIAYVTYIAAFIVFFLFFLARYMVLSLLYVVGPVILAFNVWEVTSRFKNWIVITVQAVLWTVVLKFIIAVSLSFALDEIYGSDQSNLIFVIAANILYVYLLIKTPAITSTLVGGASFGFLHSEIIEKTTEKTLQAGNWLAGHLPGYANSAADFFHSNAGKGKFHDPSTNTSASRKAFSHLSPFAGFFGKGASSFARSFSSTPLQSSGASSEGLAPQTTPKKSNYYRDPSTKTTWGTPPFKDPSTGTRWTQDSERRSPVTKSNLEKGTKK